MIWSALIRTIVLGLQPARPDRHGQRRRAAHGLDAGAHRGLSVGHAAGLRRRDVHAEPERRHPGARRGNRRPRVGASPRHPGRRRRVPVRGARLQQPQHRHPRPADHRHDRGRPHPRARCRDRRDGMGDTGPRLPGKPGDAGRRPHHRRRQGGLGTQLLPAGRPGGVRRGRARRGDGSRAVAACRSRSGSTSAPGWSPATTPP